MRESAINIGRQGIPYKGVAQNDDGEGSSMPESIERAPPQNGPIAPAERPLSDGGEQRCPAVPKRFTGPPQVNPGKIH